ncbi:hypothetical protein ACFO6V_28210 [Promicromonospora alba]|uniref:Uncharacterized protein n=1 Tax=Promicromonospora alba TaxID=1616110 RepID=A0ABV9HPM7_9MICO
MSILIKYVERWHDAWEVVAAVASIVGSGATVGAVVVALMLGRREARDRAEAQRAELERLRQERDEARQERDKAEQTAITRQREAQARRIVLQDVMTVVEGRFGTNEVEVTVSNYSDMPVFDLTLFCPHRSSQPNRGPQVHILNPNESVTHLFRHVGSSSVSHATFRDAHGFGWERRADGSLHESGVAPRARQIVWPEEPGRST